MIILIFISLMIYFFAFYITIILKVKARTKYHAFPKISVIKKGFYFNSFKTHRISALNAHVLQYANNVYFKFNCKVVELKNIKHAFVMDDYLYFKGNGKVEIIFDCANMYRYFNININSSKFDLYEHKQNAILDVMNNGFNFNNSEKLKKYINIVEKCLNIQVLSNKLVIKQNKFHLPYIVRYKLNNKIVQLNVNQTLEEK